MSEEDTNKGEVTTIDPCKYCLIRSCICHIDCVVDDIYL